ncbi:tetratricopeptide repeat protein [Sphingobacterium sp. LRF_L2]|uniref:type IX secretion system periplasmic lipoprotein PorW/SprE n=1 Tax=Sphingobacterium sp. LRF_L2 TaxID=3369421 RepID=UPI003F5F026D
MKFNRRLLLFILGSFSILFLHFSCAVFKGKKNVKVKNIAEDSLKTDFFQNLTSRYNILYNANLMLDQERKTIYDAADKNYQIRLSVFDEPTANGDPHKSMDSLIQKAYKIVNTKQDGKYINDAYFVIGKAYYLKGSYYTAVEFFDKLIHDRRPEQNSFISLAYAWKSRALLQINKYEAAGLAVDSAFMFLDDKKKTRTFVNAAKANHLVRIGKEPDAIPYLTYAIESNVNTYDAYRWKFLLAQLYRDNKQDDKAFRLFAKLANSNVPFSMSFESDLQNAFLLGRSEGIATEKRIKPFLSMLKEGKNEEYKDQILFEIGNVYLEVKDEEKALKFFDLSLRQPNRSNYQATETYLTMADYLFEKKQFRKSQAYFDSTATVLPDNYTDVNKIRRKLIFMSELTKLYEQNLWQDTLLSLGKLTADDQSKKIDEYARAVLKEKQIADEKLKVAAKDRKKDRAGSSSSMNVSNAFVSTTNRSTYSDNRFYFNNQEALMLGASEFKRKWGARQLKDDWRFSADNSVVVKVAEKREEEVLTPLKSIDTLDVDAFLTAERHRYEDSIPRSQADFDRRERIVHNNMIVIGNIYRDYTRNNKEAINAYEDFLDRFPHSSSAAEIYYSLYRMYDGHNVDKSNFYKARLVELFPNSLHAQMALDPYYMDKVNREKRVLDRAFERLFLLYTAGDHVAVIKQANEALATVFENTGMVVQVEYLKALAIGRVGRVEDFNHALQKIVDKYPHDSLVTPLAKENIAFIENNPDLFIHRVNALQDRDRGRVAFVDEPDMTPWPALYIQGDYRTGLALVKDKPKKEAVEEPKKEVPVEERKEATLLSAQPLSSGSKDIKLNSLQTQDGKLIRKNEKETIATLDDLEEEQKEIAALLEQELLAGSTAIKLNDLKAKEGVLIRKKEPLATAVLSGLDEESVEDETSEEKRNVVSLDGNKTLASLKLQPKIGKDAQLINRELAIADVRIQYGPNEYRDKKLLPDTATYYFVVNVMDPRVNLAPSRYGIGQFNRSRYTRASINHQLKLVNAENQLLLVGPFETFEEVKTYETRILPLLPEIMKVPQEDYNIFVITRETIGTLTDGIQIKNYHQVYIEQ